MKITLFALFILLTGSAFGQIGSGASSQPQVLELPSHPLHADLHELATEQSLLGGGGVSSAHGERPLSEFGSALPQPTPLGDIARAFRKEKQAGKKAEFVLYKQGS